MRVLPTCIALLVALGLARPATAQAPAPSRPLPLQPLLPQEERALKPGAAFRECAACPGMVVPAGGCG
jgi:hypothetical protein